MAYVKTTWDNNQAPAISSSNLNKIENGLFNQDTRLTTAEGEIEAMCGTINMWATSTPPLGYLLCDGSAVSRVTYSSLFAVLGTTYGTGNGSTTFNLPNLKGKVPVGRDSEQTEFNTLGETGGEKTHTLIGNEIPSCIPRTRQATAGQLSLGAWGNHNANDDAWVCNLPGQYDTPIGEQPHNNLQPYIVLNYIIKY